MEIALAGIVGVVIGLLLAMLGSYTLASVARVERKMDVLIQHTGIDLAQLAETEAAALNRAGKKIAAIKAYRELTGCGLAEAKAKIENLS